MSVARATTSDSVRVREELSSFGPAVEATDQRREPQLRPATMPDALLHSAWVERARLGPPPWSEESKAWQRFLENLPDAAPGMTLTEAEGVKAVWSALRAQLGPRLPLPCVAADPDGGIELAWSREGWTATLIIEGGPNNDWYVASWFFGDSRRALHAGDAQCHGQRPPQGLVQRIGEAMNHVAPHRGR